MPQDLPLSFLVFGLGALAANAGFAALLSLVAERKGAPSSFLPYLDPWPMGLASAALSTLLVSAFLEAHGYAALALAALGPPLPVFAALLYLRFGKRWALEKQFRICDAGLELIDSGERLSPAYFRTESRRSGSITVRTLGLEDYAGLRVRNRYARPGSFEKDARALVDRIGLPDFRGVTLYVRDVDPNSSRGRLQFGEFGPEWGPLFSGAGRESDPSDEAPRWWVERVQMRDNRDDKSSISAAKLADQLAALRHRFEEPIGRTGALQGFIRGALKLCSRARGEEIRVLPTSAFDHMVEWWLGVSKAHARYRDGLSVLMLAPQAEGGGWSGSWLDHQLMLLVGLCVLGLVFAANFFAVTLGAEYLLGVSVDALPLGNRILLGTLPMFLVAVEIYATVKLKLTG